MTGLTLFDALHYVLVPEHVADPDFKAPKLSGFVSGIASLEKVQHEVRDILLLVQAYLLPYIMGDRSWIKKYKLAKGFE